MFIGGSQVTTNVFDTISGKTLKAAVYEIGAWNMDTDLSKYVSCPELDGLTVVGVQALITSDAGGSRRPLGMWTLAGTKAMGICWYDGTNSRFVLGRETGELFDSVSFSSVLVNRGYVFAWYLI